MQGVLISLLPAVFKPLSGGGYGVARAGLKVVCGYALRVFEVRGSVVALPRVWEPLG